MSDPLLLVNFPQQVSQWVIKAPSWLGCAYHFPSSSASHWLCPRFMDVDKAYCQRFQDWDEGEHVHGQSHWESAGWYWVQNWGDGGPWSVRDILEEKTFRYIWHWFSVFSIGCFQMVWTNSCISSRLPCCCGRTSAKSIRKVTPHSCVLTHTCLIHKLVSLLARHRGETRSSLL